MTRTAAILTAALAVTVLAGCGRAPTAQRTGSITFADCAQADSQKWSKNPAISKPAIALLNTQTCQNFEQYGTATAPARTQAPAPPSQAPASQWAISATVTNPDITTSFYEPLLRYQITNTGTAAGYTPSYEAVYFHDGQQIATQDISGGNFIAPGQTITYTTAVTSAITEPAPDSHDWTVIPYAVTLQFYELGTS